MREGAGTHGPPFIVQWQHSSTPPFEILGYAHTLVSKTFVIWNMHHHQSTITYLKTVHPDLKTALHIYHIGL